MLDLDELLYKFRNYYYWYDIINGNNGKLVEKIFKESHRGSFWKDIKDRDNLINS
jgi:hypothetical protein